ncbi:XVIPCD domain-containing protein [Rhodanobacter sp. BL-MT-08]
MAMDRETQLLQDAIRAGITSPKELANFMAQVSAESNGLSRLEEGFRYTRNNAQIPVKYAHREGEQVLDAARLEALRGKPEKLAELMYGGRMGNDQPGDGYTYRGRGYMQLTGKENYAAAGKALGLDLVKHPELAAEPENASKIATWYWENRVPSAAHEDVKKATLAINGGYNGLDTRETQFAKWEKTLTPEVMQHLGKGEAAALPGTASAPHASKPVTGLDQNTRDAGVHDLQANLAKLGYKDGHGQPLQADGHFGLDTRHAVERFQQDHGLTVDGIAGPKTLEAIQQAQTKHAAPNLTDPKNPDHALYEQARSAVHKLDASIGRTPDLQSDQLAASLVVSAKHQGMTAIDTVVLSEDGSHAFAVQGRHDSPLRQIAFVPTAEAVNTPLDKSSAAAQAVHPEPVQTPPITAPVQSAPGMAL